MALLLVDSYSRCYSLRYIFWESFLKLSPLASVLVRTTYLHILREHPLLPCDKVSLLLRGCAQHQPFLLRL